LGTKKTKAFLSKANKIIVLSDYIGEELIRSNIDKNKIVKIKIFVDGPVKKIENSKRNDSRLLYLGRLSTEKGVDLLIKSYQISGVNNELYIIGDGPEKKALTVLAERCGVIDKCIFKPWQNNIYNFVATPNILVVPSHCAETFNLVGLEAMSQGVPVIAFGVGGILDWLENGKNGIEIKPWSLDRMAEAIRILVSDENKYNLLSSGALETAQNYTFDKHFVTLINCYNEAISEWNAVK
jgi:glycosyltransferase involved in cell wall biosynthesis